MSQQTSDNVHLQEHHLHFTKIFASLSRRALGMRLPVSFQTSMELRASQRPALVKRNKSLPHPPLVLMLPDIRFTRHVMEIRPTSDNPSGLLQVSGDPHDSAGLWELALRIAERITHSLGSRRAGRTHSECPCPSNRRRVSCSFVCQTVQIPAIWCRAFPVAQDTRLAR